MNKKDYIGKVVISAKTKNRFVLTEIHAAYICVGTEKLNAYGTRDSYMFKNDNDNKFIITIKQINNFFIFPISLRHKGAFP